MNLLCHLSLAVCQLFHTPEDKDACQPYNCIGFIPDELENALKK
jgi:hypothetical protein